MILFPGVAQIFGAECKKRGMLVKVVGDEIAMSPPLIMSQREVDGVRSYFTIPSYFLNYFLVIDENSINLSYSTAFSW